MSHHHDGHVINMIPYLCLLYCFIKSSQWKDGCIMSLIFQLARDNNRCYSFTSQKLHHKVYPTRCYLHSSRRVAIVGGGMAGLSVAYHLLTQAEQPYTLDITIIDKASVGEGGASAVAGGLLHPFSPSGKLIYQGTQGLQETNKMIASAQAFQPSCVLSQHLYRIAMSPSHVVQLKETARLYPQWATWMDMDDLRKNGLLKDDDDSSRNSTVLGGLLLTNGCKVIHVKNYLKGLWSACQDIASKQCTSIAWSFCLGSTPSSSHLQEFDTVVFSAGSGLFTDGLLKESAVQFPIQLVRGQSIEFSLEQQDCGPIQPVLCGKYVAPWNTDPCNRVIVGATHEYSSQALDSDSVMEELRDATIHMCPQVWQHGKVISITQGYRVQSQRGKDGRLPIVGRIELPSVGKDCWVFTGLSSRGLLYHGIFGKYLSTALMKGSDVDLPKWWV